MLRRTRRSRQNIRHSVPPLRPRRKRIKTDMHAYYSHRCMLSNTMHNAYHMCGRSAQRSWYAFQFTVHYLRSVCDRAFRSPFGNLHNRSVNTFKSATLACAHTHTHTVAATATATAAKPSATIFRNRRTCTYSR